MAGVTGEAFGRLLVALRPKLHRYCARMTGSTIDGEDVVQEALAKALEAFPSAARIEQPEAWVFRIAHNAALDFLRRRQRLAALAAEADLEGFADPAPGIEQRQIAAIGLRIFMQLPPAQRGAVILMDVLGHSLQEIAAVMQASVAAVKANLHRGRTRLRALAGIEEAAPPPALAASERERLAAYVERFNAHDFDGLRAMLAEDVRLELVNHTWLNGREEVRRYFGNYAGAGSWRLAPGLVEGRPAAIAGDLANPAAPRHFILLRWAEGRIIGIRDFKYAPYAAEAVEMLPA